MMWPTFEVALFRQGRDGQVAPDERRRSQKALLWMLEALVSVNVDELEQFKARTGKYPPVLYRSGIRYQREDGTENWQDVLRNFELGYGDCEDLACHRIAELRTVYQRAAKPFVTYRRGPNGEFHYHAVLAVKGPDGWRLEDPSRKLGMGWEDQFDGLGPKMRVKIARKMDLQQKASSPGALRRLRKVAA
jgi:hypothetical protein